MLIREGLEYAPTLYEKGTKRIKNEMIPFVLQSDLAHFAIDQTTGLARERFK